MTAPTAAPPDALARWLPLVVSVAFAVAYTQSPLYYSNQNQYFLHGLADAGYGDLSSDWLATTRDPTPVFTAFVATAYRVAGAWSFQVVYFALLMTYFGSLWSLVTALPFAPRTLAGRLAWAAGVIGIHSAVVRVASVKLFGVDYPWYFQAGVANQYLLGTGLQPSAFGALLLAALAAVARGRPTQAGVLCAIACVMHSTYLLPAGLIVLGLLIDLAWKRQWQAAASAGGIALLGVMPVLIYNAVLFAPTSAEQFAEAQQKLAWVRIPHHADVNRWFDGVAGLQLLWALIGLVALRKTPLGVPLAVATAGGLILTGVQLATNDATLALVFPWRISAVLVPLATAVLLAWLANRVERFSSPTLLLIASGAVVAVAVLGAIGVYVDRLGYQESQAEAGLLTHVASTHQPGDVYLLPSGFPKPATTRGTGANTFVPVAQNGNPAIFELQRFRLKTGAATFADFKSVPYHDVELLEWHRRVSRAADWYAVADWDQSGIIEQILAEKVTHVVVPKGREIKSRRFEQAYPVPGDPDPVYRVYRIRTDR